MCPWQWVEDRTLEDARSAFNAGADKVTANGSSEETGAHIQRFRSLRQPGLLFGSRCQAQDGDDEGREVVDTLKGKCWFKCSFFGGREFTGIDAIAWAKKAESLGAGEILLTSMDRDGTYDGFDLELTDAVASMVKIPVIASGGVGKPEHILEVFQKTHASAALAASIFHYGEWKVGDVKKYLAEKGIHVRL